MNEPSGGIFRNGEKNDRNGRTFASGNDFHEEGAQSIDVVEEIQRPALTFQLCCNLFLRLSLRMRFGEELKRILTEVLDHSVDRVSSDRIVQITFVVQRHFVRTIHVNVQCVDRCTSRLFVAENQIDPLVKMSRDEIRFQRQTMQTNEFFSRLIRPRRQFDVIEIFVVQLQSAQVEFVRVDEKFRQIEKFRNQFFPVVRRLQNIRPGRLKRMELSIGNVESKLKKTSMEGKRNFRDELSALQMNVQRGERFHSNEIMHHCGGVRVMRSVMKFLHQTRRIFERLVSKHNIGGKSRQMVSFFYLSFSSLMCLGF